MDDRRPGNTELTNQIIRVLRCVDSFPIIAKYLTLEEIYNICHVQSAIPRGSIPNHLIGIARRNYRDIIRGYTTTEEQADAFIECLRTTNTVISGSTYTAYMFNNTTFQPGDLDLYTPKSSAVPLLRYLESIGYKIAAKGLPSYTTTNAIHQIWRCWKIQGTRVSSIDVIVSGDESPITPIFGFHSTPVMGYITDFGFVSFFPALLYRMIAVFQSGIGVDWEGFWKDKLIERGFDIVRTPDDIWSWEPCRSVCPNILRNTHDSYSWTLNFGSPPEPGDVFRDRYFPFVTTGRCVKLVCPNNDSKIMFRSLYNKIPKNTDMYREFERMEEALVHCLTAKAALKDVMVELRKQFATMESISRFRSEDGNRRIGRGSVEFLEMNPYWVQPQTRDIYHRMTQYNMMGECSTRSITTLARHFPTFNAYRNTFKRRHPKLNYSAPKRQRGYNYERKTLIHALHTIRTRIERDGVIADVNLKLPNLPIARLINLYYDLFLRVIKHQRAFIDSSDFAGMEPPMNAPWEVIGKEDAQEELFRMMTQREYSGVRSDMESDLNCISLLIDFDIFD